MRLHPCRRRDKPAGMARQDGREDGQLVAGRGDAARPLRAAPVAWARGARASAGLLLLVVATVAVIPAAAAARETVGVWRGWATFRDTGRCYAIARPLVAGGAGARTAYAGIANWPGRGVRSSFRVRLSAARDPEAAVTLSVGERRFRLVADDRDAWAADPASDRAVVAALRSARSMSVEAISALGRPFADSYALAGAATAIDAAMLACAGR